MRQLVSRILLILSIINFTLAAPVLVQEIHDQAHVHVGGVPEDAIPAVSESEKRVNLLEKPCDKYSDEPWRKRGLSSESSPALSDSEEHDNWHEWAIRMYPPPPPLPPPPIWQAMVQQIGEVQQASSSSSSDPSDRGSTTVTGNKYQALPSNKGPGGSGSRYQGPHPSPEDGYESSGSNVPEVTSKPPKNPLSKFVSKSMSSLGKLFGKLKLKPRDFRLHLRQQ